MAKKTNKKKSIEFIVTCKCLNCKEEFSFDMEENFTANLINETFEKENTPTASLMFTHSCYKKGHDYKGLGHVIAFKKKIN